jgi:hypothetical protein
VLMGRLPRRVGPHVVNAFGGPFSRASLKQTRKG